MLKKIWYLIPLLFLSVTCLGQESKELGKEEAQAVLVTGSGTYSRKISTQNSHSQVFFSISIFSYNLQRLSHLFTHFNKTIFLIETLVVFSRFENIKPVFLTTSFLSQLNCFFY